MMDVAGPELGREEREIARHPAIGGVVLFDRNFEEIEQLEALTADLHGLRTPPLVLAVDHEGGRVQRFRDGFTELPAAGSIGLRYGREPEHARRVAEAVGLVAATELRRVGVDLAFAPVLDLARGNEETIGERAYHGDPEVVTDLARSWLRGARRAGFAAVGKHFPGHGAARGDTHRQAVTDERSLDELRSADLEPFATLAPHLGGVMTGHLRFPAVDRGEVVTFSRTWLGDVLRRELGFAGLVFSDDLSMAAARSAFAGPEMRVAAALAAGCDAALLLNDRAALLEVLDGGRFDGECRTRELGRIRPAGRGGDPGRAYQDAVALLRDCAKAAARPG